jgi:hypothetical protein
MNEPQIDHPFLAPLESMMLCMETEQVPLLIFASGKPLDFVRQVTSALAGHDVYSAARNADAELKRQFAQATYSFLLC